MLLKAAQKFERSFEMSNIHQNNELPDSDQDDEQMLLMVKIWFSFLFTKYSLKWLFKSAREFQHSFEAEKTEESPKLLTNGNDDEFEELAEEDTKKYHDVLRRFFGHSAFRP